MDAVLDLLIRTWQNVPLETVFQALAAAGVLSLLVQKFKKWFEVQSNGIINLINLLLSGAVVMIQGLMTASAQNPTLIPGKALGLMSLTILVYHSVLKPISNISNEVKERKAQKARAAEKSAAAVVVPEVPIESVVPQVAPLVETAAVEFAPDEPIAVAPVTPDEFAA